MWILSVFIEFSPITYHVVIRILLNVAAIQNYKLMLKQLLYGKINKELYKYQLEGSKVRQEY